MADVRHDPMTGRWSAIAPSRAQRPGAETPAADDPAACPFCAGHEDRTPPETLRLGDPWRGRGGPNPYPAPRAAGRGGPPPDAALPERALAAHAAPRAAGLASLQALVNGGREPAWSLPHTHSQLAWLRETP